MASFTLGESPIAAQPASPDGGSRDWEEVANVLLEEGLVLTALELHTELLEWGREVPCLRDYFSNPGNFEHAIPQLPSTGILGSDMIRSSSMSTFDSIELARYSDDSNRETDDRVAVLEFELRKASETIKSLRGSLTEATASKGGEKMAKVKAKSYDPIKPHEKRALNFLVHEHLMQQENKLTAITFTEENGDQDFDDWDDVGLDVPKPPNLLYLFRNYSTCALTDKEKIDRIQQLEDQLSTVTGQNLALKRESESLSLKLKKHSLSGGSFPKLDSQSSDPQGHRRRSSLGEKAEISNALVELKRRGHTRNRSSPEVELSGVTKSPEAGSEGEQVVKSPEVFGRDEDVFSEERRKSDGGESVDVTPDKEHSLAKYRELSSSVASSTSMKSDITLSEEGREREGDERQRRERSETAETITRDRSESSLTLKSEKEEEDGGSSTYHMSVAFHQQLLNTIPLRTDSRIGVEVAKLSDPELDLVQLLGRCLPHIVPNVILAKREELIPILLCVIARHPDSRVRDKLLHMMFNLIKRPESRQRHVIMSGCVAFAKIAGSTRVESELLPQMWEQITHKYYERRLLVAESCGILAPYIPPELRGSLVLSMLKQMVSEDKAESVRQAVTRSLAIIVAFTDDEDKFKQCWELVLKALTDPSQLVVSAAYSSLLPALAAWALELNTLETDIMSYFLHQLLTCIKQVSRSDGESGAVEQSQHHLLTLTHLVSWHYSAMLLSGPYMDSLSTGTGEHKEVSFPQPSSPLLDIHVIIGDDPRLSALVAAFDREVQSDSFTPWRSLDWFCKEYLGRLMKVSVVLGFSQAELVHSLVVLLSSYCTYLGRTFTQKVVGPLFEQSLTLPKQNPGSALAEGMTHLTTPVLPVYVAGVLGTFVQDEKLLISYLRGVLVDMALYFAPMDSIKATFRELKRERRYHTRLLGLLQDLVAHSSFQVRRFTAVLFGVLVRNVDDKLVMKVVLPQLMKLARDAEIAVRIDTIGSFGTIMEAVTSKEILVRVHEQFEAFMDQEQYRVDHQVLMAVLRTLAKIGPHADPVFRDEFIIPRLAEVAMANTSADNMTKRQDISAALLEAYRNISECFVSIELLNTYMLPGLQRLAQDLETVQPAKVATAQQLIANCRTKMEEYQKSSGVSERVDNKSGTFFSNLMSPFDREVGLSPSKLFKRKS